MRSLQFAWLADRNRSLRCHFPLQGHAHHSIHRKPRTGVKGRGQGERELIASPGTFCVLRNADDMGKVKENYAVQ
jgi:hypothetical protein